MKKISIAVIVAMMMTVIGTTGAFAENQTTVTTNVYGTTNTSTSVTTPSAVITSVYGTTDTTTTTPVSVITSTYGSTETTTPATVTSSVYGTGTTTESQQAGVTPDSPVYPFERLIESIQVALTFSPEGKAELLVSFANERLAEAKIMTEENKVQLVQKVLDVYAKTIAEANSKVEEAALQDKDVKAVLQSIQITEEAGDKIVIKATGIIPQESAEALKSNVNNVVTKTLAVQTVNTAKQNLATAKTELETAKAALEAAQKSQDPAAIKAAEYNLLLAKQKAEQMELAKKQIVEYKDKVLAEIKVADKEEVKKELNEKLKKKIEKFENQAKKHAEKKEAVAKKLQEKNKKAAQKIRENAKKQLEHKKAQIEKFKGKFKKNKIEDEREDN